MSSSLPFADRSLAAIATFQYYVTAAIVLFYYEYLITLGREVRFAWKKKFSYMSILFLSLRYITFFAYIPTLLFAANSPSNINACLAFAHFPGAMSTVSFGIITIFLVLRTYALYYRRFWVLAITVPLGILNAVLAAICLMKVETIPFSIGTGELSSCIPELILSATPFKTLWSITIAFDTLISVLTISKTYQMHNASRKVGIESRLVVMILQDGSLYYCVMTAANVVNFAMFWAETFNYIETSAGISSEIIHSISVIIVCRMMLNIMEASDPQVGDYSDSQLESQRNLSSVRFVTQHSAITTGPRGHLMQQASESVHENAIGKGAGRPTLETVKEITMGTRTLQMTIDSSERSNHSMPVYDPFTQC